MGGPLSVTLANIHMTRMENDIVVPRNPDCYKRYLHDIYSKRKKDVDIDEFLSALKIYTYFFFLRIFSSRKTDLP